MKSLRGGGGRAAGQFDGRSGQQNGGGNIQCGRSDERAQDQVRAKPTGGVKISFDTPQQSGGRGKWVFGNNTPGNGSSGNKFPGTGFPDKFSGNGTVPKRVPIIGTGSL